MLLSPNTFGFFELLVEQNKIFKDTLLYFLDVFRLNMNQ